MGILDAPVVPKDSLGRRLDGFYPQRDLPGLTTRAWWVADDVPGVDGSAVPMWLDRSGRNASVAQPTVASRPTIKTNALNGHRSVAFNGNQILQRSSFGTFAPPHTVVALFKAGTQNTTFPVLIAGIGANTHTLLLDNTSGCFGSTAGTLSRGGPTVLDNAWHIGISVACLDGTGRIYLDGYQIADGAPSANTQSQTGTLGIGGQPGASKFTGEIAELIWLSGEATFEHVNQITTYLAAKGGLTLP